MLSFPRGRESRHRRGTLWINRQARPAGCPSGIQRATRICPRCSATAGITVANPAEAQIRTRPNTPWIPACIPLLSNYYAI